MELDPHHGTLRPRSVCRRAALPATRRRRSAALAIGLSLAFAVGGAAAAEYEVCLDVTPDIRALGSDDLFESEPAADRLSALGPAAWPALVRALEREGPAVREAVVGILAAGSKADDSVRQGLARAARNDPEAEVRGDAVAALRKLAGKQSYDVVVAELDDPSPAVRRKAITACSDLCTGDAALARLVGLALADEPIGNALQAKRVLWSLTADGSNREVVGRIRSATIAASRASDGSGRDVRERRTLLAALLLAELGDDDRLDDVARATAPDQPEAIRVHALNALGRLGGADRVALVAGLQQDPAVAVYAHDALRRMSERGIAGAGEAAAGYTGTRAPQLLPRP
jgi:hypothetical protein